MRKVRVHLADPDFEAGACPLKFTLTYEGPLRVGKGQPGKKHAIRRQFHKQLKRLWDVDDFLANWVIPSQGQYRGVPAKDWILEKLSRVGKFQFLPLVNVGLELECALDFRVLRPTDTRGEISDIDNQIKTLVDSLKMPEPSQINQIGDPAEGEDPLYVVLEDDRLVTKITSINDELLQPVYGKDTIESQDVRIFIDVHIRPMMPNSSNIIFFSGNDRPWDHKYDEHIPQNLIELSTIQLKSITTQCIFRIVALSDSFSTWDNHVVSRGRLQGGMSQVEWDEMLARSDRDSERKKQIWHRDLWPKAAALKLELCRRIYGQPPYPSGHTVAIDYGMLAGINPLAEAAKLLDSLVRQLPG